MTYLIETNDASEMTLKTWELLVRLTIKPVAAVTFNPEGLRPSFESIWEKFNNALGFKTWREAYAFGIGIHMMLSSIAESFDQSLIRSKLEPTPIGDIFMSAIDERGIDEKMARSAAMTAIYHGASEATMCAVVTAWAYDHPDEAKALIEKVMGES